jgi:acetyl esterase/lipase
MVTVGEAVPLWDGVAPGSETWTREERALALPPPADMTMLRNVFRPTLTPVLPDAPMAAGTGVVVCPGGGYLMLAIDHEGFEVADWLAARGIAAFVLKYRVLETGSDEDLMETLIRLRAPPGQSTGLPDILRRMDEFASIPLADGLAAMSLVRDRAEEWGVQADRVGALGFSAGARLVVDLATHDETAVRPDFAAAIYGPGSARRVPADAPPLFIAAAADDPLFDGSVETHAAWRKAGCPIEAHFYARGGHGFGMRKSALPADHWIEQFHEWMAIEDFTA